MRININKNLINSDSLKEGHIQLGDLSVTSRVVVGFRAWLGRR